MASLEADKPIGIQLFGQAKKEAASKASDSASKGPASKSAPKKAQKKPQESNKKKGKGSKPAARHWQNSYIGRRQVWCVTKGSQTNIGYNNACTLDFQAVPNGCWSPSK